MSFLTLLASLISWAIPFFEQPLNTRSEKRPEKRVRVGSATDGYVVDFRHEQLYMRVALCQLASLGKTRLACRVIARGLNLNGGIRDLFLRREAQEFFGFCRAISI
ncbi:MAG: hypothetical protein HZA02_05855 [Nitrospinae bacterium]|nr:hypothetical protein [Nitrospinota bacterium]